MSQNFRIAVNNSICITSDAVETKLYNSNMSLHAKKEYCKGSIIMQDQPITFIKPQAVSEYIDLKIMFTDWVSSLALCQDNNVIQILNILHPRVHHKLNLISIYNKLKFNMFESLEGGYHLFGLFSFINHSCAPNSIIIQLENMQFKLVALTDIKAGEEITVDYLGLVFEERQKQLQDRYNFICSCGHCNKPIFRAKFLLKNNVCWNCNSKKPKFRCSKCKVSGYCSIECQKTNWKIHKTACNTICKVLTYDPNDPDIVKGVDIENYKLR